MSTIETTAWQKWSNFLLASSLCSWLTKTGQRRTVITKISFLNILSEHAMYIVFCDIFTFLQWTNTLPLSTSCVVMAIRLDFSCQIMRHMSPTVVSFGPAKDWFSAQLWSILISDEAYVLKFMKTFKYVTGIYIICSTQRHSQAIMFLDHWTIYRFK